MYTVDSWRSHIEGEGEGEEEAVEKHRGDVGIEVGLEVREILDSGELQILLRLLLGGVKRGMYAIPVASVTEEDLSLMSGITIALGLKG